MYVIFMKHNYHYFISCEFVHCFEFLLWTLSGRLNMTIAMRICLNYAVLLGWLSIKKTNVIGVIKREQTILGCQCQFPIIFEPISRQIGIFQTSEYQTWQWKHVIVKCICRKPATESNLIKSKLSKFGIPINCHAFGPWNAQYDWFVPSLIREYFSEKPFSKIVYENAQLLKPESRSGWMTMHR